MILQFTTHQLIECDACHETIAIDDMPGKGWYRSVATASGRVTKIDLCYDCSFKLTNDDYKIADSEADRVIASNQAR